MNYQPGDKVLWFRVRPGSAFTKQIVSGVVTRVHPHRVTIRVKDASGTEVIRYVLRDQLEMDRERTGE